jgi:hypothetical protein
MAFIRDYTKGMQQALLDLGFWKSCINCDHWANNNAERKQRRGDPTPICHKFNSVPPADVIVISCVEGWEEIIPF